jgi:surface antigen
MRQTKRIVSWAPAILLGIAVEASASTCFLPVEAEADQAMRLRARLMVIAEICQDPAYAHLEARAGGTIAAYEQITAEHQARGEGPDAGAYLARLVEDERARAGAAPSYCADAADFVASVNGMGPDELRSYAASEAGTASTDYPLCPAPSPPAATAVAAAGPAPAPPKPPARQNAPPAILPAAAAMPAPSEVDGLAFAIAASDLARRLDPADRRRVQETTQRTLETVASGQIVAWRNPYSRSTGTVVAQRAFRNPSGQWCRGFEQSITVDRETLRAGGTACRRADGWWDIGP